MLAGTAGTAATLPFTGLSLVWWILLAGTLLVIGASLLRAGHAVGRAAAGELPEASPRS